MRSRGLSFGGSYQDQASKEDPPFVFPGRGSSFSDSDFEKALEVSEKQGWGWILYEFPLRDGEPEPLDLILRPHPDSQDKQWLVAEIMVNANHLHLEEEMDPFLTSIVIPTLQSLRPDIAVGDVLEDYPYLPSVPELERGVPSDVCWFNFYGPRVVKALGSERLKTLEEVPRHRLTRFDDGAVLMILESLPSPDPREYLRTRLNLRGNQDRQ